MENRKYIILFLFIAVISVSAYLFIPNFEREEFDVSRVEEISTGTVSTTTTEFDSSEQKEPEKPIQENDEIFDNREIDNLLIHNTTKKIDSMFTSYLVIGSDERSENSSASRGSNEGSRADVILIVNIDKKSNISLVSLPRDLLIEDPCTSNIQRINSSYKKNSCGSAEENLSAVILNITGLRVQNFVKFNFEGFEKIIDSVDGVEICVDTTQREGYSFEIPKGCSILNGEIALNWIVSRNTEILDGEKIIDSEGNDISNWKPMPGVSDLTRIQKQQQLILAMMQKVNDFESLNSFYNFVNALEDTFIVDKEISILEATNLLWDFRDIDFEKIIKLTVPTKNYITDSGAQVLILTENFYNFFKDEDLLD